MTNVNRSDEKTLFNKTIPKHRNQHVLCVCVCVAVVTNYCFIFLVQQPNLVRWQTGNSNSGTSSMRSTTKTNNKIQSNPWSDLWHGTAAIIASACLTACLPIATLGALVRADHRANIPGSNKTHSNTQQTRIEAKG